ncbi:MAG: hypothetical protein CME25_17635 [Gemmatimonadetes bacterium]|nr:hypothetical protein [Gemmatimonadota bacterium]
MWMKPRRPSEIWLRNSANAIAGHQTMGNSGKTYRVCILGCRGRGTAAGRAYHAHPRTEVVGLCDLKSDLLATLGDDLGVAARYTDLDQMISELRPEIVAIPTGTEFHYELSMRVLEYGVNIDVEKPICVDLVQADTVIKTAAHKGVRTAVHHQGRVGASMKAVSRAVKEGRIGRLRHVSASGKGYYGGYGLMNIGTHLINYILEIAGPCNRVSASALTNGKPIGPEDVLPSPSGMGTIAGEHITAYLEFEGNVTASLSQHRFPVVDSAAYAVEVFGTEGRLFWKSDGAWILPSPHFVPEMEQWEPLPLDIPDQFDPSKSAEADFAFAGEFAACLDDAREHTCSGIEGRHVLEIMMGIFESAAYGMPVPLPQIRRDHPLLRWLDELNHDSPPPMPRGYVEWLAAEDERIGRA